MPSFTLSPSLNSCVHSLFVEPDPVVEHRQDVEELFAECLPNPVDDQICLACEFAVVRPVSLREDGLLERVLVALDSGDALAPCFAQSEPHHRRQHLRLARSVERVLDEFSHHCGGTEIVEGCDSDPGEALIAAGAEAQIGRVVGHGVYVLRGSELNLDRVAIAVSMSFSVVKRPRLIRTPDFAVSRSRPSASRTRDGSDVADAHAEPLDTASCPLMLPITSSAGIFEMPTLRFPATLCSALPNKRKPGHGFA